MPFAKKERKISRHSTSNSISSLRRASSHSKTQILINIYDLLPPGTLARVLWPLGLSLLHTGITLNGREYSYGATSAPTPHSQTGVFWTRPGLEPPGGTHRMTHLQGFTYLSAAEIDNTIKEASNKFPGRAYNLLTNNCNHFTNYLCQILTKKAAPSWINRAATVGIALPCIVPTEWINAPEMETADGELLEEEEDSEEGRAQTWWTNSMERRGLLTESSSDETYEGRLNTASTSRDMGERPMRDSEGRALPASERAPPGLI